MKTRCGWGGTSIVEWRHDRTVESTAICIAAFLFLFLGESAWHGINRLFEMAA